MYKKYKLQRYDKLIGTLQNVPTKVSANLKLLHKDRYPSSQFMHGKDAELTAH